MSAMRSSLTEDRDNSHTTNTSRVSSRVTSPEHNHNQFNQLRDESVQSVESVEKR
jgi:hypothetical protein